MNNSLRADHFLSSCFLYQIMNIASGVFLLSLASQFSIPLTPVPFTFQTIVVVLIGVAWGARMGSYIIGTYSFLGGIGLPIFSNFSFGLSCLFGATGGYLLGFLPAAWISGYLSENGYLQGFLSAFNIALLSISIIFSFGVLWLSQYIGFHKAVLYGVMPFISSEILKLIIIAVASVQLGKR